MPMFGGSQFRAEKFIALHGLGNHILSISSRAESEKEREDYESIPFFFVWVYNAVKFSHIKGFAVLLKLGFYGTISVEICT